MSRTNSQCPPARARCRRFTFGPLVALTLLLVTASLPGPPTDLDRATATVVMVMPRESGTAQVVVVQVPSCGTGSPCLLVREVTPPADLPALVPGSALIGSMPHGQPSTLEQTGHDPGVPSFLILLACGVGLLLLRRAILVIHGRARPPVRRPGPEPCERVSRQAA